MIREHRNHVPSQTQSVDSKIEEAEKTIAIGETVGFAMEGYGNKVRSLVAQDQVILPSK